MLKITNYKLQITNYSKGFTLVEMTVVMAIIAILLIIGAPAMISARYQFMVDSVAEDMISTIRTAQNNAISIKGDPGTCNDVKVWGVRVENNEYVLSYICPGVSTSEIDVARTKPYSDVTISDSTLSAFVYFSTPFGAAKLFNSQPVPTAWYQHPTKIEQSYTTLAIPINTGSIAIPIEYRGHRRTVTIYPNGDVDGS